MDADRPDRQTNPDIFTPREQLLLRYIEALDAGDAETVGSVLEAALTDPEMDRLISEVHLAMHDELELSPLAADARVIRALLRTHIPSAFAHEDSAVVDTPVTVSDVAARLIADRRVPDADREPSRRLLDWREPLPVSLSRLAISRLREQVSPTLSDRYWSAFRDAALMLGLGQAHQQMQLAATRQARARYRQTPRLLEPSASPFSVDARPSISDAIRHVYTAAGIGEAPSEPGIVKLDDLIASYPIRVAEVAGLTYGKAAELLASETGRVIDLPANDRRRLSGFLYCMRYRDALYGCILVDRDDPVVRRRFSAAHELGHYVMHFLPLLDGGRVNTDDDRLAGDDSLLLWEGLEYSSDDEDALPSGVLITDNVSARSTDRQSLLLDDQSELDANQFAADLLLPEAAVRTAVERLGSRGAAPSIRRLSSQFLVSRQAMHRRLSNLGLLNDRRERGQGGSR